MYRHIGRYFLALLTAILTLAPAAVIADEECEPGKSMFVNIASERPNAVQVALMVAFANAAPPTLNGQPFGGQNAAVQLFLSDAAAAFAIDVDTLTPKQRKKLNNYVHKEFLYRIDDIIHLQGPAAPGDEDPNGDLPDIRTLQYFGARVFACSLCLREALTAAGVDPVDPMTDYLLAGATIITPGDFAVAYDRIEMDKDGNCYDVTATVISF